MPKLKPEFEVIALALQEASVALSHSDIHQALNDQLNDTHPQDDTCVCDVYGDDQSGDVVYKQGGQIYKAPYSLGSANGKRTAEIDEDSKTNVVPRTVYDTEADDEDSMVGMNEADRKDAKKMPAWMRRMVFGERFIGKAERDSADAGSFAGKNKSFPILKPGDVMAAVRSMGRAGSDNVGTSTLKANIIRIAKKKGWTKYLPQAWQGDESFTPEASGPLKLRESTEWVEDTLSLIEAAGGGAEMEIKIIAPGQGSSAFYPKEVLQRDGPGVFKKNTQIYINHATRAEESERPEGDWHKLVGALSTDAYWKENAKHGEGLYAMAKFADEHAPLIREKAPYSGMSIRANGVAESGKTRNGVPVLKELTSAESVDIVTKAGAGGMILTEAARSEEVELTLQEAKQMIKQGIAEGLAPVRERLLKQDAREAAAEVLDGVDLPEPAKRRIIDRVIENLEPGSELDVKKLRESVVTEAKAEGQYIAQLTGGGRVLGMGIAPTVEVDRKEAKKAKKELKEARKSAVQTFMDIGMDKAAAKIAARGKVA